MESNDDKKYWAFISYSSKDRKWGQWLHKRLESYPIPPEFRGVELFDGAVLGKNLRPVFRDRDELSGSSELGPAIAKALEETRYLIVLCSPNSAQSEWVNKEIEDFKALGRERQILALILDGYPNATANPAVDDALECFPPALRYPAEPLAGDLRKEGDGKERGFLKILSGIAQLDFDTLYRRHERAQRRRRLALSAVAGAVILSLTALTVLAFIQWKRAEQETTRAVSAEQLAIDEQEKQKRTLWQNSLTSWASAEEAYQKRNLRIALAHLAAGLESAPSNTRLVAFAASILEEFDHLQREVHFDVPVIGIAHSESTGSIITVEMEFSDKLHFRLRDPASMEQLDSVSFPQKDMAPSEKPDAESVASVLKAIEDHPWLSDAVWSLNNSFSFGPNDETSYIVNRFHESGTVIPSGQVNRPAGSTSDLDFVPSKYSRTRWMTHRESHDIPTGVAFISTGDATRLARFSPSDPNLKKAAKATSRNHSTLICSTRYLEDQPEGFRVGPYQLGMHDKGITLKGPSRSTLLPVFDGEFHVNFDKSNQRVIVIGKEKGSESLTCLFLKEGASDFSESRTPLTVAEFNPYTVATASGSSGSLFIGLEGDLFFWPDPERDTMISKRVPAVTDTVGWLGGAAISPDEKSLALGYKRQLLILDLPSLELTRPAIYHETIVSEILFSEDGHELTSSSGFEDGAGSGGYTQIWKFPEMTPIGNRLTMKNRIEPRDISIQVSDLKTSVDGSVLATGSSAPEGSTVRLWDSATTLPLSTYVHGPSTGQFFLSEITGLKVSSTLEVSVSGEDDEYGHADFTYRLPIPEPSTPEWFHRLLLPYLASCRISEEGIIQQFGPEDIISLHSQLEELTPAGPYGELKERFFPVSKTAD